MNSHKRLFLIFLMSCGVGVAGGLFGVAGGVLLVPMLVVAFGFEQHLAQGTSLVAMVPPTGLLAFINYAAAGEVNWTAGLWIMPGVFFGAMAGSRLAQRLSPRGMRRTFAALVFVIGVWEASSVLRK
jgi:uncharacterized membrane protein YfcA